MGDEKWTIEELETLYLLEYDEDEILESTGDEVQDFLNWCKQKLL